jgi:N-acetylglucosamine-6-phosphate deacetylase
MAAPLSQIGLHLEGPFINPEKKGAHPLASILDLDGAMRDLYHIYGSLDNVAIVTLAPELPNATEVTRELVKLGITVSLGEIYVLLHSAFFYASSN